MGCILAISSQVARGHVGLSAIVPTLQAFGRDVIALPTILLSNHPGHATFAGERVSPELLRRMLESIDANGWLTDIDGILTGYLPSAEHAAFACDAITRVKVKSPAAFYLCDPVIGDDPKGVYIPLDAANEIRDRLLPIADLVKCNRFELEWLSGKSINNAADAEAAARHCGLSRVAVTSMPAGIQYIENVLIENSTLVAMCRVERHPRVPQGTGDTLSALLLGKRLFGSTSLAEDFRASISGLSHIIDESVGHDELQLATTVDDAVFKIPALYA